MRGPLPSYRPECPTTCLEQAEPMVRPRPVPDPWRPRAPWVLLLHQQPLVSNREATAQVQRPRRSVQRWRRRWAMGDGSLADAPGRARQALGKPISRHTAWRMLATDAINPWRYQYWSFPRDPHVLEKAGPMLAR
jgi:hypothetical protein